MNYTQKQEPVPFVEHYLRSFAKKESLILDVGCGSALYRNSTPGRYVGIDIYLETYRHINGKSAMDIVAPAGKLPFHDATFDIIFSKSAFYQFQDTEKILKEFYRVLKSNGRIILFDYNKRTQKRIQKAEGTRRPCWTQWKLKKIVQNAGFKNCSLLIPSQRNAHFLEKSLRLIKEELLGQWAIVTGIK